MNFVSTPLPPSSRETEEEEDIDIEGEISSSFHFLKRIVSYSFHPCFDHISEIDVLDPLTKEFPCAS